MQLETWEGNDKFSPLLHITEIVARHIIVVVMTQEAMFLVPR